ncbi:MAG: hypothetical protein COV60_03250 [Candidatus Magasanikbacteria bacterium CG11_big_fil_rev_8_21_14_0_20_43_7]|uniref:N-acetyltransferase domain-containing protein n=1 Tax=Candidatus Magasanikbacteria bacterium CG11_big_fil_rev_8_21_14_0_20_43_7 TaxID=1974654 RepID=A0A2H0N1W2_9BACT|nr:MAG: hypothetical protein COV60_03250 [Candidatus Magasanikbacteria bacterium CG11_big_fil_rev_8_21_14_0_20_43_7]
MTIRPIQPTDYACVEELVKAAILEINAKVYSQPIIERMLSVDPYRPRTTLHEREYFVALIEGEVRGVVGMKENEVKTFFVDPNYHGEGVGTKLISHIEKLISKQGYSKSIVFSTISAQSFYENQGYAVIREVISDIDGEKMLRFYMEKKL